jgi:hypothetical protein
MLVLKFDDIGVFVRFFHESVSSIPGLSPSGGHSCQASTMALISELVHLLIGVKFYKSTTLFLWAKSMVSCRFSGNLLQELP